AEAVEQGGGGSRRIRLAVAVEAGEVGDVLPRLHLRVEAALLRHVAEAAAVLGRHGRAVEDDLAGVGLEDAERDPHGGGLAGAVAADEAGEASRTDVEAHVVERATVAIRLRDAVEFEHGSRVLVRGAVPKYVLAIDKHACYLQPSGYRAADPKEHPMATNLFVNLPADDLERAKQFYLALGAELNEQFTD